MSHVLKVYSCYIKRFIQLFEIVQLRQSYITKSFFLIYSYGELKVDRPKYDIIDILLNLNYFKTLQYYRYLTVLIIIQII